MTREEVSKRLKDIAEQIDKGELTPLETHFYFSSPEQKGSLCIDFYITNTEEQKND